MSEVPEIAWFDAPDLPTASAMLAQLLQAGTKAKVMAGGTDLIGAMKDRLQDHQVETVVHIGNVPGLDSIAFDGSSGQLRIGAAAHVSDVASSPIVKERFPLLSQAAEQVASPQIRNMGTLGGNLNQRPRCWYYRSADFNCYKKGGDFCFAVTGENQYHAVLGGELCYIVHPSDTAPALVALGASARIVGPDGEKIVPFEQYFTGPRVDVTRENILGPADILAEVIVPEPAADSKGVYLKVRERGVWDFATVAVAVQVSGAGGLVNDARIVLGGVAPYPYRVPNAEAVVRGRQLTDDVARQAGEIAFVGARPMTNNLYKVAVGKGLVARALMATLAS
jgi:xanthine dehydrogenase YagS FAD-binding subunit